MLRALLALVAALALAGSASAAPIVIDTFSDPPGGQSVSGPIPPMMGPIPPGPSLNGSFAPVTGAGVLGTRNLSYAGTNAMTGNTFNVDESIRLNQAPFGGLLRLSTVDSAVEITLDYSSFGTLDVSGMFTLDVVFVPVFDPGIGGPFEVTVTLGTTTGTKSGVFPTNGGFVPGGGVLSLPLSGLSGPGSLSSVTSITIALNDGGTPNTSSDFSVTQIQFTPVPEPATLATLSLLGVFGGYAVRRRMKAAPVAQA